MSDVLTAPSPLRKGIDGNERIILARVAAWGDAGYLFEAGKDRAFDILTEDGYLTRERAQGTARTYFRYRVTQAGRNALYLVRP